MLEIKKVMMIAAMLIVFFNLPPGDLKAEGADTSGSVSVDVMSNYVWRGFKLSDSFVIQPSVGITYGSFGANLWANYDTDTDEHNETDLTLNYSFSLDKFSFNAGYIYYALDSIDDTQEVYLTVGYDILISPALSLYYDLDEGDGAFVTASIGHDFALARNISLSLGALVSYNFESEYSIGDYSDFHNAELSASVNIPVWKNITAGPVIVYSFPLSDNAEDAFEAVSVDGDSTIIYGGMNLSLSF